ncbi:MAG: hypothetical protein H0X15_03470 [Acidobacteria bacterium]|jgi:hypothetical protein|nr:hypothetical protein [Acidobacteriota bacterium]MBA3784585.1 hypothetical protein [Acidobacteriota bacterium]MBA4122178.1 hypothetical protein [Acidobacteriota bacterium]MBA4183375.1 hypothetical protein [Acidobacteriota bacterium]
MRYKLTLALITNLLVLMLAMEFSGQTQKSKTHHGYKDKSRQHQSTQTSFAGDYKGLVKKLRAGGARVKRSEKVSQPFFSVEGRILVINGEQVQIFEYKKTQTADTEVNRVSASGSPVDTTMVTWVAPPHFYHNGKLIVLYIGENSGVIKALENALGRQFAGK